MPAPVFETEVSSVVHTDAVWRVAKTALAFSTGASKYQLVARVGVDDRSEFGDGAGIALKLSRRALNLIHRSSGLGPDRAHVVVDSRR